MKTNTTVTTPAQPPQLFEERRAFDAKLAALDRAQSATPEAIRAKQAEDEARRMGYHAMADGMLNVRENEAIFAALNRGDHITFLALSEARDRKNKLRARGLS